MTGGTRHEVKPLSGTENKNLLNLRCYTYPATFNLQRRLTFHFELFKVLT